MLWAFGKKETSPSGVLAMALAESDNGTETRSRFTRVWGEIQNGGRENHNTLAPPGVRCGTEGTPDRPEKLSGPHY